MSDVVLEYIRREEEKKVPKWDILDRVVAYMREGDRAIGDEEVRYFTERFPFTRDEYRQVTAWLEYAGEDVMKTVRDAGFPTYEAVFEYRGHRFVWRLMIGQGSDLSLLPATGRERKVMYLEREEGPNGCEGEEVP